MGEQDLFISFSLLLLESLLIGLPFLTSNWFDSKQAKNSFIKLVAFESEEGRFTFLDN